MNVLGFISFNRWVNSATGSYSAVTARPFSSSNKISDEEGFPGNLIPTSIVLGEFNIFAKFGIWRFIIYITKL